jgi:predicted GNAT family N-acyltransferase
MSRRAPPPPVSVRVVAWSEAEEALRLVRREVFVREQRVTERDEWDGRDETAVHALAATADGTPVGTGRLLREAAERVRIGRMAVRVPWRRAGVGGAILTTLLARAAALGCREVVLDAQLAAIPFYERHGFAAEGAEFLDAGILHRRMRRALDPVRP